MLEMSLSTVMNKYTKFIKIQKKEKNPLWAMVREKANVHYFLQTVC